MSMIRSMQDIFFRLSRYVPFNNKHHFCKNHFYISFFLFHICCEHMSFFVFFIYVLLSFFLSLALAVFIFYVIHFSLLYTIIWSRLTFMSFFHSFFLSSCLSFFLFRQKLDISHLLFSLLTTQHSSSYAPIFTWSVTFEIPQLTFF